MLKPELLAPAEAFALAHTPMREKRWLEANALWQVYREQYVGHPAPWTQGAICLMRLGELPAADTLLKFARQHYAPHATVWLACAEWARLQDDADQELIFLTEGLTHCPGQWELLYRSAELHLRRGDVEKAQACNDGARETAGERTEPLIQHAELAEKREDWSQAEARWLSLIQEKPLYKPAYSKLAAIYAKQGKTQEARRYRLAGEFGAELLAPLPKAPELDAHSRSNSELLHFSQLIMTKAWLGMKSESARTHLSHAWVVIEPLLHLAIYYYLFGKLLNAGVENYALFLLSGLVPWMWFAKAISTSSTSILNGQSLMLTTNISPAFFPLVSVVQATLKQLPALLSLLALGLATDVKTLSWNLTWLPLILLVQLLLTTALALLIAAIIPFLRDLANLVATGLMLLMVLSGVIYNIHAMPGQIGQWLEYNPLAVVISAYRQIILEGSPPDFSGLGYAVLVSGFILLFCAVFYRRHRRNFVRRGMR